MIKLETNARLSKAKIFDMVYEARQSNTAFTPVQLDYLINYFAPPIPKKPKTPEQWVALAVAKTDVRYYLNYLHVRDGKLWATDGKRMHWCGTDLADGFYCPKTLLPAEVSAVYPDVYRVIPDKFIAEEAALTEDGWAPDVRLSQKNLRIVRIYEWAFQEKFILAAISAGDATYRIAHGGRMRGTGKFGEFVVTGVGE